jgi:hypothetical protein
MPRIIKQRMNQRGTYLLVNTKNETLATFRLKMAALQYITENYSLMERRDLRIVKREDD